MTGPCAWLIGVACLLTSLASTAQAQPKLEYGTDYNVGYYDVASARGDEYRNEHCKLDIYYPKSANGFATIVWFHGGGLTEGRSLLSCAQGPRGRTGSGELQTRAEGADSELFARCCCSGCLGAEKR